MYKRSYLNDAGQPVNGYLPNEGIGMFHRKHQALQYLIKIHLLLRIFEVLVRYQQLGQDRLQELER